jgi:hypothetical protein
MIAKESSPAQAAMRARVQSARAVTAVILAGANRERTAGAAKQAPCGYVGVGARHVANG